jgi:hypothetical protein
MGTHRFQRAVSAGGALGINGPPYQDCTLEAMRTQFSADHRVDCKWIYAQPPLVELKRENVT